MYDHLSIIVTQIRCSPKVGFLNHIPPIKRFIKKEPTNIRYPYINIKKYITDINNRRLPISH